MTTRLISSASFPMLSTNSSNKVTRISSPRRLRRAMAAATVTWSILLVKVYTSDSTSETILVRRRMPSCVGYDPPLLFFWVYGSCFLTNGLFVNAEYIDKLLLGLTFSLLELLNSSATRDHTLWKTLSGVSCECTTG